MNRTDHHPPQHDAGRPGTVAPVSVRTTDVLWLLLVLCVVANAVASGAGAALAVHAVLGTVAAVSGSLLVVRAVRSRR